MAAHLELLNLALVYLSQRQAPVKFLRHLGYACEGYQDEDLLPFRRLIVQMPPRHGKSELCSRWFPAWYLGNNPHHRIILAAYEARFARTWGMKARDILGQLGAETFDVRPAQDNDAANDWGIEVRSRAVQEAEDVAAAAWRKTDGGMVTAGVGGPITGRGADGLIVDDPVKNAKDAESEAKQADTDSWWDSTAQTRLEPDGWVLIIQTRWHMNDLAGQVLRKQEEEDDLVGAEDETWYVISLPAIAEENDVLGREVGEALWSWRYPIEVLLRRRARTSAYVWNALYQQRPSPPGGVIFKRQDWQRFESLPVPLGSTKMVGCIIVDTATDDDERLDPVGVMTMYRHDFDFYITRWTSVQMRFTDMLQEIIDQYEATRPTPDSDGLPIVVEDVPWARPTIHSLEDAGFSVIRQKPEGSKMARALSVQHYQEGHHCWLPRRGAWVGDFIEQTAAFPTPGIHDEGVDNLTAGLIRLGLNVNMRDEREGKGEGVRYKRTAPKPMDLSIFDDIPSRYDRSARGKPARPGPMAL
jgi:predicted phage terminase large subunit-like protein